MARNLSAQNITNNIRCPCTRFGKWIIKCWTPNLCRKVFIQFLEDQEREKSRSEQSSNIILKKNNNGYFILYWPIPCFYFFTPRKRISMSRTQYDCYFDPRIFWLSFKSSLKNLDYTKYIKRELNIGILMLFVERLQNQSRFIFKQHHFSINNSRHFRLLCWYWPEVQK